MQVEALVHRMEQARVRLTTSPPSPARDEGVRRITSDLDVMSRARGQDLEEVQRHCQQADRLKLGGQVAGTGLGLGIGVAMAASAADPITAAFLGIGGAAVGVAVFMHLGKDGAGVLANKFVQGEGVKDVVQRWTSSPTPIEPAPPGKQNAVTDLLGEVRTQLCALPDGPDKTAALQFIDKDLKVAGQATGTTLPELQASTAKRERLVKIGTWTGVGVGVVISGALVLRACQGLVDPLTAIRGTVLGSGIALAGGSQAGKWIGGKLGDRHQVAGMQEVLQRWQPIFTERERMAQEAEKEAKALLQGGEKASIGVEAGGLRVEGVLLRIPKKR